MILCPDEGSGLPDPSHTSDKDFHRAGKTKKIERRKNAYAIHFLYPVASGRTPVPQRAVPIHQLRTRLLGAWPTCHIATYFLE